MIAAFCRLCCFLCQTALLTSSASAVVVAEEGLESRGEAESGRIELLWSMANRSPTLGVLLGSDTVQRKRDSPDSKMLTLVRPLSRHTAALQLNIVLNAASSFICLRRIDPVAHEQRTLLIVDKIL